MGGFWEKELEIRYDKEISRCHLITHFQCDMCHFDKIQDRGPDPQGEGDMRLMFAISGAALGAFWSREPVTVRGN